jgi:hypothetical protein
VPALGEPKSATNSSSLLGAAWSDSVMEKINASNDAPMKLRLQMFFISSFSVFVL